MEGIGCKSVVAILKPFARFEARQQLDVTNEQGLVVLSKQAKG